MFRYPRFFIFESRMCHKLSCGQSKLYRIFYTNWNIVKSKLPHWNQFYSSLNQFSFSFCFSLFFLAFNSKQLGNNNVWINLLWTEFSRIGTLFQMQIDTYQFIDYDLIYIWIIRFGFVLYLFNLSWDDGPWAKIRPYSKFVSNQYSMRAWS